VVLEEAGAGARQPQIDGWRRPGPATEAFEAATLPKGPIMRARAMATCAPSFLHDARNTKAINVRRLALYASNYYSKDEEDPADVRDYGSTLGSGFDESKSAVHTGGQQQHSETCTREIEISSGTIICCNHCTHRLKWCLLTLIASLSIALIHQFLRWLGRDFR
jgi:hypothetical protein